MPRIQDHQVKAESFFTEGQLQQFGKELTDAGSFDELMVQKGAAKRRDGNLIVLRWDDADAYRKRFLTGVYEGIPFHTDLPFRFWEHLLKEWRKHQK